MIRLKNIMVNVTISAFIEKLNNTIVNNTIPNNSKIPPTA